MDEIQKKVCTITDILPNCLSNRRILQSGLSDILAGDRLHINLLLSAYDENIVDRLMSNNDAVIVSTNMIRRLKIGYGFSDELCAWSVITWLFILKRDDDAIAVFNLQSFGSRNTKSVENRQRFSKQEPPTIFCTKCGNRFKGTENFCGRCGEKRNTFENRSTTVIQDKGKYSKDDDNEKYFCPSCATVLNTQQGFRPNLRFWTCKNCDEYLYDEGVYSGERFKEKFWFCQKCNALLNTQDGFRDLYDYWKCAKCSYVNHIAESELKKTPKIEKPELPSLLEIRANNFTSEKDLVLATIDYYKEKGKFPDDDFILSHKETFFEISRMNIPQRYGAYLVLGECYLHGIFGKKFIGEKNILNAILCYEEAIKSPIPIPLAEIELFNIYYRFMPDYDKALTYCESAIEHGDPMSSQYLVREYLEAALENDNEEILYEAMSACIVGASMKSVPPYRERIDFFICCYICAVMGQIIAISVNDKRKKKSFDKLTIEIKRQIQAEFNYPVLEDEWFEEIVNWLLTDVFELTPKQLAMVDLTEKQRRAIIQQM